MNHRRLLPLHRSNSHNTTTIIPSPYISSTSFIIDPTSTADDNPLVGAPPPVRCTPRFIRSIINILSLPAILPSCRWLKPTQLSLTPSATRKVTGTLFGNRRGHVSFAVQQEPRSAPVLIVELAVSTAALVKEMSSGMVRIALECEKQHAAPSTKLFQEAMWSMYCNGRKYGYAQSRACTAADWYVLRTVQTVTVGAGVIPVVVDGGTEKKKDEGELLYMRARFERVVGSRDSEAFYMINPDGGGPELSIFLLRI